MESQRIGLDVDVQKISKQSSNPSYIKIYTTQIRQEAGLLQLFLERYIAVIMK